jgi:GT2 family glycosyltransferase/glycosyltransferase involved in cell wall biosynthesis
MGRRLDELRYLIRDRLGPANGRPRKAARHFLEAARAAPDLAPFRGEGVEREALRAEQELAASFLKRYTRSLGAPVRGKSDGSAVEEVPVDRRGVIVDQNDQPDAEVSVDVVVCVHDALDDLRRCLRSLLAKTGRPFHLILVDDGSGPETGKYLRRFSADNPDATLVTRAGPPHGYTLAANDGLRASNGDYVIFLNSDTIVTFGWLNQLIECGESDRSIGIVGPLSNAASHQSVPKRREGRSWAVNELPAFLTADGMAFLLAGWSSDSCPRLPFLNGSCYAVKRATVDTIGLFDAENFASGYCEENDYSYRASLAGFELAVAEGAYVYHAKSRSYGKEGRREVARRNYQLFLRKHGEENIAPLVQSLNRGEALEPLRARVTQATADLDSFARAFRSADPEPLRIAFLLQRVGIGAGGGVHSIYQETRGMRALGVDARILVAEGLANARRQYADADEMFVGFEGEEDLHARSSDRNVIVATEFGTVELVRRLGERRDDFLPAYYAQDYEPFFFDPRTSESREATHSYEALPDGLLFAKTGWLCDLIGRLHGIHVAKVEPSLDHQVFRAGSRRRKGRGPVRVVGMVRPRTGHRQPLGTLRLLDRIQTELAPDVEVLSFGCGRLQLRRFAPQRAGRVENLGRLTREEVADVLGAADVFLDFSSYQAFGRTALEAMACGCAPIVPRVGGTSEYAVHGENAYVIDTTSEEAAFEAVCDLVADRDRLHRLQHGAVLTAERFSVMRAAVSEYVTFAAEYARRGLGAR